MHSASTWDTRDRISPRFSLGLAELAWTHAPILQMRKLRPRQGLRAVAGVLRNGALPAVPALSGRASCSAVAEISARAQGAVRQIEMWASASLCPLGRCWHRHPRLKYSFT